MSLTEDLLAYLQESPSPYHCVDASARRLTAAGFAEWDERAEPTAVEAASCGFVRRAGTLVAWRAGTVAPSDAGFLLLAAHTDSPNLRIKPRPDVAKEGYRQWGVEVYGGALLATWPDRDLGLSGRVVVRGEDGRPASRLFREDRPIARIPNVAIHLNRDVNKNGLVLDAQKHLVPVVGLVEAVGDADAFAGYLARRLDVDEVLGWDLGLHDVQPPAVGGLGGEFVFAARLDNQASCFQALTALLAARPSRATQVVVLFDHEEVGSRSAHGAMGAFLRDVLSRLERDHDARGRGGLERAIAHSFLVSMDMAHGVHPNYAELHEPNHRPVPNGGPVVKEHVELRYATDAESGARFRLACAAVGVPVQDFVIRTDLACGSTIGPISAANLGIQTVDVGAAMLSMHSIREQMGAEDTGMMVRVLGHLLAAEA